MLLASLTVLPLFVVALPHETQRSIPIAKHTNLLNGDGTVNVDALQRHISYVEWKIRIGSEAYERNTGLPLVVDVDVDVATAADMQKRREDGLASNPLVGHNAMLWYGTISVGTPPVEYKVDFDTGSSDTFLPGVDCQTNCNGHVLYDPSKSRTSHALGKSYSLTYGDGSTVSGMQYTDVVSVAGLTAKNQTLGSSTAYSPGFSSQRFPADGLMGMGYQSLSAYPAPPFFQTLMRQGRVRDGVFGFKLVYDGRRGSNGKGGGKGGSELTLGGVNRALFKGDITYTPVIKQAYWMVKMGGINVGGKRAVDESTAIIDTGTTLIIGPQSKVSRFYQTIPGAKDASSSIGPGLYTVPCSVMRELKLSLEFGGRRFVVDNDAFNLGYAGNEGGERMCVGGVAGADVANIGWVIGDVFLQNVYTVFDLGKNRVGFAELA